MAEAGIQNWRIKQKRMASTWLGKVLRSNDGRWSRAVLFWDPLYDFTSYGRMGRRHQGGQKKKWLKQFYDLWEVTELTTLNNKCQDEKSWNAKCAEII